MKNVFNKREQNKFICFVERRKCRVKPNDNDWMDYLREEEANFLPEPPDGLWEGIESRLPSGKKRGRIVPLWVRYSGVAACVALVFGVGLRLLDKAEEKPLANKVVVEKRIGLEEEKEEASLPQTTERMVIRKELASVATEQVILVEDVSVANDTIITEKASPKEDNAPTKKEKKRSRGNTFLAYDNVTRRSGSQGVSVSLYAGNLMANNTAAQGGYDIISSAPLEGVDGDDPYDDIADLNQGMETETKRHYRLPLRAGVRVSFPLTDRFAIESGVAYTLLSSTMESGSQDNYYNTEQTLHYIGIPLKLRCHLWQGKRVGVYVSGGGMVEKCVSGKAETDFYVGGDKHTRSEQSIREKPLQLSATLSAGIEANIVKSVSLFAEPGMSYYFNNHSGVDNIYKDKPLNVDLNIGIRVNINK